MNKVQRYSAIDMQAHRKEGQQLQRSHEILLVPQDKTANAWPDESSIIAERETYDAIMAEVLPLVANSRLCRPNVSK